MKPKYRPSIGEVSVEAKELMNKLTKCKDHDQLSSALAEVKGWHCGKCDISFWSEVLDMFDPILEECSASTVNNTRDPSKWPTLAVDQPNFGKKVLLKRVLAFSCMLMNNRKTMHSLGIHAVHEYSSSKHLIKLLSSSDMSIVSAVLKLLHTITGPELGSDFEKHIVSLTKQWNDSIVTLTQLCQDVPINSYPNGVTTLKIEQDGGHPPNIIENVRFDEEPLASLMDRMIEKYKVPSHRQFELFAKLRFIQSLPIYQNRVQCVLVHTWATMLKLKFDVSYLHTDSSSRPSIRPEEFVNILQLADESELMMDIKIATLKIISIAISIQHNEQVITVTDIDLLQNFLPSFLYGAFQKLIFSGQDPSLVHFELLMVTLAATTGHRLPHGWVVACHLDECLYDFLNWKNTSSDHLMFITQMVSILEKMIFHHYFFSNLDMCLRALVRRLVYEVDFCAASAKYALDMISIPPAKFISTEQPTEKCKEQCAALRCELLIQLLKCLQICFAEPLLHKLMCESSLWHALQHIFSNAYYYGPDIYSAALDLISVTPPHLWEIHASGYIDMVMHSFLVKPVPLTEKVFEAVNNFLQSIDKLKFKLAISKTQPFALIKNLVSIRLLEDAGSETMAKQVSKSLATMFRQIINWEKSLFLGATRAITSLLNELCRLGTDPKYIAYATDAYELVHLEKAFSDTSHMPTENVLCIKPFVGCAYTLNLTEDRIRIPLHEYMCVAVIFTEAFFLSGPTTEEMFEKQVSYRPLLQLLSLPNIAPNCFSDSEIVRSLLSIFFRLPISPTYLGLRATIDHLNKSFQHLGSLLDFLNTNASVLLADLDFWLSSCSVANFEQADCLVIPTLQAISSIMYYLQIIWYNQTQFELRESITRLFTEPEGHKVIQQVATFYVIILQEKYMLANSKCANSVSSQLSNICKAMVDFSKKTQGASLNLSSCLSAIKTLSDLFIDNCHNFLVSLLKIDERLFAQYDPTLHDNHLCIQIMMQLLSGALRDAFSRPPPIYLNSTHYRLNMHISLQKTLKSIIDRSASAKPLFLQYFAQSGGLNAFVKSLDVILKLGKKDLNGKQHLADYILLWLTTFKQMIEAAMVPDTLPTYYALFKFDPKLFVLETRKNAIPLIVELWSERCSELYNDEHFTSLFRVTGLLLTRADADRGVAGEKDDTLAACIFHHLLQHLDRHPSLVDVFTVQLLPLLVQYNSSNFNSFMTTVIRQVSENASSLLSHSKEIHGSDSERAKVYSADTRADKLLPRLHLLAQLAAHMADVCVPIICHSKVTDDLLDLFNYMMALAKKINDFIIPKWVTPMLLMIDTCQGYIEGIMIREQVIRQIPECQWKYKEGVDGPWIPFDESANKQLNKAYKNKKQFCNFPYCGTNFTVNFGAMRVHNPKVNDTFAPVSWDI